MKHLVACLSFFVLANQAWAYRNPSFDPKTGITSWQAKDGVSSYSVVVKSMHGADVWGPYYHYATAIELPALKLSGSFVIGVAAPGDSYEFTNVFLRHCEYETDRCPQYDSLNQQARWNLKDGTKSYSVVITDLKDKKIWGPYYHYAPVLLLNKLKLKTGVYKIGVAAPSESYEYLHFDYTAPK